jgi:drug/metabolite transporter (DMT)-like permease
VRFALAGVILLGAVVILGGTARIRLRTNEVASAAVVGALILGGGVGLVTYAEQDVPSGLAAVVIASVPLWVIVLRLLLGERVAAATIAGVVLGFAGVALLILPGDRPEDAPLGGLLVLVLAAVSTAAGAVAGQRLPLPVDPLLATSLQMLSAGVLLVAGGLASGERLDLDRVSGRSALAFLYLLVVGSLIAYTAFVWLLQRAPVSLVTTYAYVNPVVALFLGWALLSEEITAPMLAGAAVIVASVAFVIRRGEPRAQPG